MFNKESIELLQQARSIVAATDAIEGALDSGKSLVALPSDFEKHDLEMFMPNRRRARGLMTTNVISDFAAYMKQHKEEGASVFVDGDSMSATAVLNLGTPATPGHADNKAKLVLDKTAAYSALLYAARGEALKQLVLAEFLEDWADNISCANADGEVSLPKAIGAVRKLSIEAMRKMENSEQQLSASKSTFESVQATSTEPIPTHISFKCVPYVGLAERVFVMRLGILTSGDKPSITLRIVKSEQHEEEMARELAGLVSASIGAEAPVLIGGYSKS